MKKLLVGIAIAGLCFSGFAQAHDACKKIAEKCEAAGYHKNGNKQGMGLWDNCMRPILMGQKIDNVKPSRSEIRSCRAKMKEMKQMN